MTIEVGVFTMPEESRRIRLPLPTNLTNTPIPHTKGPWLMKRAHDAYIARAVVELQNQLVPKPHYQHADLLARFRLNNLMDHDNLTARLKWPLDALRKVGIIVDDKPEHLRLYTLPTQEINRGDQGLELLIWEREPYLRPADVIGCEVFP